ncbi:MAG: hypothetical protein N2645_00125 [Clostridia bacterium]|nr:hypothetical protein [Clostridia bacterium]
MKKLVLIFVCVFLMTIFIALNYLLWDRENKSELYANKSADIDMLKMDIRNYQVTNQELKMEIERLKSANEYLSSQNATVLQDRKQSELTIQRREKLINKLKQGLNIKSFEDLVKKWADNINKGDHIALYSMLYDESSTRREVTGLYDFINDYKNSVKSVSIKSVDFVKDKNVTPKIGEIILKVNLNIEKPEKATGTLFNEGANTRYFIIAFNEQKISWYISEITDTLN